VLKYYFRTPPPIKEDILLEKLCESTHLEPHHMKGTKVTMQERRELFNKFQRHSETEVLFKSEDTLNKFVADLYSTTNTINTDNKSCSLTVNINPLLRQSSNTSLKSIQSIKPQNKPQRNSAGNLKFITAGLVVRNYGF
jgi:hypothetical protein